MVIGKRAIRTMLAVASLVLAIGALTAQGSTPRYSIDEVGAHIGEYATVTGMVAEVFSSSKGTAFLDFGAAYPHQAFSAVIFGRDAAQFDNLRAYQGKTVSVTGKIRLYRGKPEIIVNSPEQLVFGE